MIRIGGLFFGYGGLDLAVRDVLGGENVWVADNDPGILKFLAHRYRYTLNLGTSRPSTGRRSRPSTC